MVSSGRIFAVTPDLSVSAGGCQGGGGLLQALQPAAATAASRRAGPAGSRLHLRLAMGASRGRRGTSGGSVSRGRRSGARQVGEEEGSADGDAAVAAPRVEPQASEEEMEEAGLEMEEAGSGDGGAPAWETQGSG